MNNTDTTQTISHNNTQTHNGYKKTVIGIIPVEWEVKKLSELCFNKGEYGINAAAVDFKEDLPGYIRITDIDDDGYFSSSKKCSVDDISSSDFYLNKNDIVFIRTGSTTGKAYLYNEKDGKLVFAGFLIRFKIDISKVNDYFIWSYTQSKPYWDWVKTVCTRSGQPGINSTEYASIQLPIPPLPEQQKIAKILSTWDEAIAKCKTAINTLKDRNKGLAQQLLTGKKRLNGFNDKWEETLLKKVIIEYKVKSSTENQYEVLTSSKKGLIKQSEYYNKGRIIDKENKGFNVIPRGFITYRSRSDDSIFTFNQNKFNFTGIVSTYYPVFEFKNCNNNYLVKLLNLNSHKIGRYSVGTSQLVLSLNELKQIKLSFPIIKEQNAIVEVLDIADKELNSYETKLEALQLQKKGLMQQLLTGKIRVNVN